MPEYDNTNRFSIFKNDDKQKDSHPDYKGTLNVDGREFWLSAWLKTGKNGKFFSGSIKPKDAPRQSAPARKESGGYSPRDEDESIPFAPEWR